jgi:2-polyprenyl-3-methyl-5-hydroxy-6-metoxy-1,4-benzoquinol methylase
VYQGADFLYKLPGVFFVASCTCCGLLYQNPCPSPELISRFYPSNYLPHRNNASAEAARGARPWWWRRCAAALLARAQRRFLSAWQTGCNLTPDFVAGGRLLEIGCANGSRLAELRKLGWSDLRGVELVEQAAELARNQGFAVTTGRIEDHLAALPDASLDVVVCSMVLEHLSNPFEIVALAAGKLKPGGQFLFSTIVSDSLDARIYGRYFAGFDFPRHLVHFSKGDLLKLVEPYFHRLECFHQNAPIDYVRSSSWRLEHGDGAFFDRAVLRFGNSRAASLLGLLLALTGLTCRVSFRCRKR